MKNGWGIYKYHGTDEYNGQFVDGNHHGIVMITYEKTGTVEKWIFENDKKVKQI